MPPFKFNKNSSSFLHGLFCDILIVGEELGGNNY